MTTQNDEITSPAPLAYALAPVAGFVDVVAFVMLAGVFASSMGGNAVQLAVDFGEVDMLSRAVALVLFVAGVALAIGVVAAVVRRRSSSSVLPLLTAEAVLIALFMLVGTVGFDSKAVSENAGGYFVMVPFPVLAMAIHAVMLRKIANMPVQTAYVTGMLFFVGEETVEALAGWSTPRGAEARRRLRIHGSVWLAYLAGGFLGAVVLERVEYIALLVPLVALVGIIAVARAQPGRSPTR